MEDKELFIMEVAPHMMLVAVTANSGLSNHPTDLAKKAIELSNALANELFKEEEEPELVDEKE